MRPVAANRRHDLCGHAGGGVGAASHGRRQRSADPPSPTAPCNAISPFAFPCVGTGKFADAVAAECRRIGVNDNLCLVPLASKVTQAATVAYLQSWVHRTAQFQYALGNPVAFKDAQWIGTHNSFNSLVSQFTPSHADSNQQLSMPQQLDIDARSIELDLHYIPQIGQLGNRAVTVCHGRGPDQANLGCTTEPVFTKVLPTITDWLNTNPNEVVLILIEDQLKDATAYASALDTMERQLRRPNGTSLIYHPAPPTLPRMVVPTSRGPFHATTCAPQARRSCSSATACRAGDHGLQLGRPGSAERLNF